MSVALNKQSNNWMFILNDKKEATEDQSIANFETYQDILIKHSIFSFVATIIHDKDIYDKDDEKKDPTHKEGQPKRIHLHAYIESKLKTTASDFLKYICELIGIEKEQISLEDTNSDILGVQYLTHQNKPLKAQYKPFLIKTNNRDELDKRLGAKYQSPEEKEKEALFSCRSITDLINATSVEFANKHRAIFNDIKKDQEKNELIPTKDEREQFEQYKGQVESWVSSIEVYWSQLDSMITTNRIKAQTPEGQEKLKNLQSILHLMIVKKTRP